MVITDWVADPRAVRYVYRYYFEDWCGHELSVRLTAAELDIVPAAVCAIVRWTGAQTYDAMILNPPKECPHDRT